MILPNLLLPLGTLSIALAQSVNARKQLAWQREQFELGQMNMRLNAEAQRAFQFKLNELSYKRQIQNQISQYVMNMAWPLKLPPSVIAEGLGLADANASIPLNVIVAPIPQSGVLSKFAYVWGKLARYIERVFPNDGQTPVIVYQGAYKPNFVPQANSDYLAIFQGLKGVPTLYIAPYATDRDQVLGIKIAIWGVGRFGDLPHTESVEIDLSGLYRRILRDEVREYEMSVKRGKFKAGTNERIEKNGCVFIKEEEWRSKGSSEDEIARLTGVYNALVPCESTFIQMGEYVLLRLELMVTVICDLYWVLGYGASPMLMDILKSEGIEKKDDYIGYLERYVNALLENAGAVSPHAILKVAEGMNRLGYDSCARTLVFSQTVDIEGDSLECDLKRSAIRCYFDGISDFLDVQTASFVKGWMRKPKLVTEHEFSILKDGVLDVRRCECAAYECLSAAMDSGIKEKLNRSFEFFKVAALNGSTEAMVNLAKLYAKGLGCSKDMTLAQLWRDRAQRAARHKNFSQSCGEN